MLRNFLAQREVWFDEKPKNIFLIRYFQQKEKPEKYCFFVKMKRSLIINLNQNFYDKIKKNTRYDARKLKEINDQFKINCFSEIDKNDTLNIISSYNNFAKDRRLSLFNISRLNVRKSSIYFSQQNFDKSNSYHVYISSGKRIRLLYSWSKFFENETKKVVDGLNKLHTINDFYKFSELGFKLYDFGGFNSSRFNGIDRFKSQFGGFEISEYNYIKIF